MQPREPKKTVSSPEVVGNFAIAETSVRPGETKQIELPVSRLPGGSWLSLPVAVIHGKTPGKCMWLSGAVHGDELNGLEIIRELLHRLDPKQLTGTVIAVPMVNVFGVLMGTRTLPDRRDLNRSFPGSRRGSLASRLARLLMDQVIERCQLGIDFHTGSNGRDNLPHVRIGKGAPKLSRFAQVFGAPVIYHAEDRDGSLRWAAANAGIPTLVFEGGEAMRLDEHVIKLGVEGTLRVMHEAGLIARAPKTAAKPTHCHESTWVRARSGGICRIATHLGARVKPDQVLAVVNDAFNAKSQQIRATDGGIVIGIARNPLVNSGDALVHIAVS